jgi:FtsP/CotA-like multicopper oxidase with cupredoxin domain
MHVHGGPFEIVETDGNVVPEARGSEGHGQRRPRGALRRGLGGREAGEWLIHCHIPHHTTNDNTEQEGGGV